jgi:hypothetical protein
MSSLGGPNASTCFIQYPHVRTYEQQNYAQLLQCAASTSISSTDWVHISDEICQRVSEEKVLTAPAYMLFYEKRDVCQ